MATTASTYYSKINIEYPYAGKDNDSQIFRNNFTNIQRALESTDQLVETLKLGIVTTSSDNNFGFNTIRKANFENCSISMFDDAETNGIRSSAVTVDYRRGNYQKFSISSGLTTFSFINWPSGSRSGSILFAVVPASTINTQVSFGGNVEPIGELELPLTLSSQNPAFFELWSENGGATIYVTMLGYKRAVTTTGTDITAYNSITIGTNKYQTGTNYNTVVTTEIGTSTYIGNLAILPNITRSVITNLGYTPSPSTTNQLEIVTPSQGSILIGASFNFSGTVTNYTVAAVESSSNPANPGGIVITTVEEFPTLRSVGDPLHYFSYGDDVVFTNPQYQNQATIVTFDNTARTTSTGIAGDTKGLIYANSTSLYVSHENHSVLNKNWLVLDTEYSTTQAVTDNSRKYATTEFTHSILPYGSIIMWYGNTSNVPTGWALCNGTNNTPDLRNKFVIGANSESLTGVATTDITGTAEVSGGSKDAIVVSHHHTITDPGHSHKIYPGLGLADGANSGAVYSVFGLSADSSTSTTGISIVSTGTSGVNMNLPPFYAVCYIMKITGA